MATQPIQRAVSATVGIRHSDTELARVIAATKGLEFDEQYRVVYQGRVIAETITDFADHAVANAWIADRGTSRHIFWEAIPHPASM